MSLYSEWVEQSEETLKKSGLSAEGVSTWNLRRSPIYLKEGVQASEIPVFEKSFLNITPFSPESWDSDFLNDSNSAVLFNDKNYKKKSGARNIFFQSSFEISEAKKHSLSHNETNVNLGIDPYSLALWKGELCSTGRPFSQIDAEKPGLKVFRLSSLAYDLAGATPSQQLAILLSSAHQLIKDYEGVLPVEKILSTVSYELSLSNHFFVNVAKIQSLRLMLARFYEVVGLSHSLKSPIYGTPSPRYLATREPWNNMLRLTTMTASAMNGGAQGVFALPFDLLSQGQGLRQSRNNVLVLEQESFLKKVNNASSGSGLVENLLSQLCHQSWIFFQEIEKKGGILSVLQSGWLQDEIEIEHNKEKENFVKRNNIMVGVNDFALTEKISEDFPLVSGSERKKIADWWIGYINSEGVKKLSDVQRLKPHQLSSNFENWQFLADKYRESKSKPLKVSVFCEDSRAQKEKLSMVRKLMGIAGVEIELCDKDVSSVEPVCLFISADPTGETVLESLNNFKEKGCKYSLWVGARQQPQFDGFIGNSSDLMESYERIFKVSGVFS